MITDSELCNIVDGIVSRLTPGTRADDDQIGVILLTVDGPHVTIAANTDQKGLVLRTLLEAVERLTEGPTGHA